MSTTTNFEKLQKAEIVTHNIDLISIKDVMTSNLIALTENQTVQEVVTIFEQKRISGAPVYTEDNTYLGMFSKTDLFKTENVDILDRNGGFNRTQIADITNRSPIISIKETLPIERAAQLMLQKHIHRLFVHNEERQICGVLSSFDVLKVYALNSLEPVPSEVQALRNQVTEDRINQSS